MEAFMIVAIVLVIINSIFLMGSLIYTLEASKSKGEPRLSTLGSVLDPRMSLQPQVTLYDAIARLSGNPSLSQQQLAELTENRTIQAAQR